MGLLSLLWLAARAEPAPPPPPAPAERPQELLTTARKLERRAVLELSAGLLAAAGGAAIMTVGRPSGEVSRESQGVSDARSIGGAGLVVGGVLSALVGGDTLGRARNLRERAGTLQTQVPPSPPLLVVQGRF